MTEEQIKSLQSTGGEHLAATEKKYKPFLFHYFLQQRTTTTNIPFLNSILGNNLPELWAAISDPEVKGSRIDFVLDNAGFELYCDCVFGAYSA